MIGAWHRAASSAVLLSPSSARSTTESTCADSEEGAWHASPPKPHPAFRVRVLGFWVKGVGVGFGVRSVRGPTLDLEFGSRREAPLRRVVMVWGWQVWARGIRPPDETAACEDEGGMAILVRRAKRIGWRIVTCRIELL